MASTLQNQKILFAQRSNSEMNLSKLKNSIESAIQSYASAFGYWLELKS
jgi:hypothetical protein